MSIILNNDVAALVVESANGFATAFSMEVSATDSLACAMGTAPTFEHWEAVSNAWKAQYRTKKGASDDATNMAWTRAVKRLGEQCGLDKPKAATKGATKKAESRSEASKKIEAVINQAQGDAAKLADEAAKATKAGDAQKAKLLVTALDKVQKEAAKAAKKDADAALAAKRKTISEMVKNADAATLDKLIGLLTGELVAMKKKTATK